MIDPDSRGYRLLSVARLLKVSLQRTQQLIRAYTFVWQFTPPLPAGRPEAVAFTYCETS
jgi:hypothetical protein